MKRRRFTGLLGAGLISAAMAKPSTSEVVPRVRLILCLLGPAGWLPSAARCVEAFGRGFHMDHEYSAEGFDSRMPESFGVSWNWVPNTYTDSDLRAIGAHQSLVYVLSEDLRPINSMATAAAAVELIDALFAAGALACKCETGGVAHGAKHWRSYAERLRNADDAERAHTLYRAFVRRPLDDDGVLYTAGMHSLGFPDIDYLGPRDLLAATALIDTVGRSVLAGDTQGLPHSPCTRYPVDAFLYNPYGVLRIDER